ncbi:MAG: hypothetical protein DMD36_07405 [Gemmatimonadetes bacterium]|nr:MAG: hypothetical protein DMD36_07405 [Gemmatimonadota bacterium]
MAVVRSRVLAPSTWLFPGNALLALSLFLAAAPCRAGATVPSVATRRAVTAQPTTTMARHRIAPAVQATALDASRTVLSDFPTPWSITLFYAFTYIAAYLFASSLLYGLLRLTQVFDTGG